MPVLDAKALSSDPEGLALLRDVLRPAPRGQSQVSPQSAPALQASCQAPPVAPAKPVTSRDMLARLNRAPAKRETATADHTR